MRCWLLHTSNRPLIKLVNTFNELYRNTQLVTDSWEWKILYSENMDRMIPSGGKLTNKRLHNIDTGPRSFIFFLSEFLGFWNSLCLLSCALKAAKFAKFFSYWSNIKSVFQQTWLCSSASFIFWKYLSNLISGDVSSLIWCMLKKIPTTFSHATMFFL